METEHRIWRNIESVYKVETQPGNETTHLTKRMKGVQCGGPTWKLTTQLAEPGLATPNRFNHVRPLANWPVGERKTLKRAYANAGHVHNAGDPQSTKFAKHIKGVQDGNETWKLNTAFGETPKGRTRWKLHLETKHRILRNTERMYKVENKHGN